ncbi:hypothetical protein [Crocosphaera watsonii]|nr:hypothetical protein [Crocosphaera sp.]
MTTSQEKIEQTLTPSKPYKPHVIFRLLPTLTLVQLGESNPPDFYRNFRD